MLIDKATERQKLTDIHGDVWNTTELQRDFSVESFLAPLVIVTRRSDGQRGTLDFNHYPRFYYNFRPH